MSGFRNHVISENATRGGVDLSREGQGSSSVITFSRYNSSKAILKKPQGNAALPEIFDRENK